MSALTASLPSRSEVKQKTERLDVRLAREAKEEVRTAANLRGVSVSTFVTDALAEAARRVVNEYQSVQLAAAESRAFVEALLNPPAPNARLRAAVKRYRASMRT